MNSTTNLHTLTDFRRQIYNTFERASDALMNTVDALLTETQAQSLPELSLSPLFQRRWHSLYEAFEDGRIHKDGLRKAFVCAAPLPTTERLLLGTDASSIARPHAKTARDRTLVHEANLPDGCPPVVAGWQFSTLALLPQTPSSWTYTLDNTRIVSDQKTASVAAEQLRQVIPLLPQNSGLRPLLVADGYYSCLSFLEQTRAIACDLLVRLARNRVLYRSAPPKSGKRGRPKKHGTPFACANPTTQGIPDASFENACVAVACWKGLHFKEVPDLLVSVLRVTRSFATGTKRDPKVSWFVFVGEDLPALSQVPVLYGRRYSIEHGYRVDKQDLLWERVRLRTPEQLERFTDVIACVRNQLCLAKSLVRVRQAWERKEREVTPSQVRRGLRAIMGQLGTPAQACRVRGKSPGRVVGAKVTPATRYPVIRKSPKKPRKPTNKTRK